MLNCAVTALLDFPSTLTTNGPAVTLAGTITTIVLLLQTTTKA